MRKNVMIPVFLLERIIQYLEDQEPSEYCESRYEYGEILWALELKLETRKFTMSYADFIQANAPFVFATTQKYRQPKKRLADSAADELPF